jgi:hypothetical protein
MNPREESVTEGGNRKSGHQRWVALTVFIPLILGVFLLAGTASVSMSEERVSVRCEAAKPRICGLFRASSSFGSLRRVGSFPLNDVIDTRNECERLRVKNQPGLRDFFESEYRTLKYCTTGVTVRGKVGDFEYIDIAKKREYWASVCGDCANDLGLEGDGESFVPFCDDCEGTMLQNYDEMKALTTAVEKAAKGSGARSFSASNAPWWFFGPLTNLLPLALFATAIRIGMTSAKRRSPAEPRATRRRVPLR